jgi:thioredoxin-related protein
MKRFSSLILLLLPLILFSQEDTSSKGIKWTTGLSWDQIKQKAKLENKYIFVDCYATWCGPCKWMDKNVLSDRQVVKSLDSAFVTLQLQMDKTSNDLEQTMRWYGFAADVSKEYSVEAYPTYLIFSLDGKLIHRFSGSVSKSEFMRRVNNSFNKETQYYFIRNNYHLHDRDSSFLLRAINICLDADDRVLAKKCLDKYLGVALNPLTRKNIPVFTKMIDSSNDILFHIFLSRTSNIDSVMGKSEFAERSIAKVLKREIIDSTFASHDKTMDWNVIASGISLKYPTLNKQILQLLFNGFQDKIIKHELFPLYRTNASINWDSMQCALTNYYLNFSTDELLAKEEFKYVLNQGHYEYAARLTLAYLDKYADRLTYMDVNDYIWSYIFERSTDTISLKRALKWSKYTVEKLANSNNLDTYANLLYKLGENNDAIIFEKKALKIATENNQEENVQVYQKTLEKMAQGIKTWK